METNRIIYGNALEVLKTFPEESIDMVMTSPPYRGARDYGEDTKAIWGGDEKCKHDWKEIVEKKHRGSTKSPLHPEAKYQTDWTEKSRVCQKCGAWHGQLGLEPTFQQYIENLLKITEQIKRVLKKVGSFYFNIGDGYSHSGGHFDAKNPEARKHRLIENPKDLPEKTLMGLPWRIALKMIDEQGWRLRNAIVWFKPNHMPSSVKDRLTNTYEFLFHFVKAKKYYYDLDAIRVPMTNLPFRKDKGEWQRLSSKYEGVKSASESGNKTRIIKERHGKYKQYGIHSPGGRDWYLSEQRPNLPEPRELIAFLKRWLAGWTIKGIDKQLGYKDTASHWFTDPESEHGFAYPTKEQWLELKDLLGFDDAYDERMTKTIAVPVTDRGHPRGKNPGDVFKISPEVRRKTGWRGSTIREIEPQAIHPDSPHKPRRWHHPKGKNPGDYWEITTKPNFDKLEVHFALFPEKLCEKPILSSCPENGIVLDPLCGLGTTCIVAKKLKRRWLGIDIKKEFCQIAREKIRATPEPLL